jgi:hypothetical protein
MKAHFQNKLIQYQESEIHRHTCWVEGNYKIPRLQIFPEVRVIRLWFVEQNVFAVYETVRKSAPQAVSVRWYMSLPVGQIAVKSLCRHRGAGSLRWPIVPLYWVVVKFLMALWCAFWIFTLHSLLSEEEVGPGSTECRLCFMFDTPIFFCNESLDHFHNEGKTIIFCLCWL